MWALQVSISACTGAVVWDLHWFEAYRSSTRQTRGLGGRKVSCADVSQLPSLDSRCAVYFEQNEHLCCRPASQGQISLQTVQKVLAGQQCVKVMTTTAMRHK